MYTHTQQRGFTLIELLLYVGVFALMMSGIASLVIVIQDAHVKHQTISEVEENGEYIMSQLTRAIRNSEGILVNVTNDILTIDVVEAADDPTVIQVVSGNLEMTEGTQTALPLHSSRVTATDFTVTEYSRQGSTQTVQFSITLSHNNPSGRFSYNYEQTFTTSATIYGQ